MAKVGRKSNYERLVEPYLEQIKVWKKNGATDEQIWKQLGISRQTYYDYQKRHPEFVESIKKGTFEFVQELRGNLASLCYKHNLETKKTYIKVDVETGQKTQYTEITTREVDPDIAALNLLLKNVDRENWSNDPQLLELKKQEMELRKALAKADNFDLEIDDNKED